VNAFRAELLKVGTTRLLLWYGLGLAAFMTLVVSIHVGTDDRLDLQTASSQRSLLAVSGLSAVVAVLVGTVLVASEYHHGTINQSLLAIPDRVRLLAAKLGAALLVGAVFGVFADALILALAELWYGGRGLTLHLGGGTATPLLGAVGAAALGAALGLGVAAILRRQTASIVIVLLWLLIGENIVAVSPDAARYAPGHVIAAVVTAHSDGSRDVLAVWAAVAVGAIYAAILSGLGTLVVLGSDAPATGD
jgi:ABC-type transport system involved in multi-copper enzyme maturation permease subunit